MAQQLKTSRHQLGGGLIEPCRDHKGLWEIRVIHQQWLAREFFGFDHSRVVLLHGYIKRDGEPASQGDVSQEHTYWTDYLKRHKVSPEAPPESAEEEAEGEGVGDHGTV